MFLSVATIFTEQCYIKDEIESKDVILLKETWKHADYLTLAKTAHLFSRCFP